MRLRWGSANLSAMKTLLGFGNSIYGSKPAGSCSDIQEVKVRMVSQPFHQHKGVHYRTIKQAQHSVYLPIALTLARYPSCSFLTKVMPPLSRWTMFGGRSFFSSIGMRTSAKVPGVSHSHHSCPQKPLWLSAVHNHQVCTTTLHPRLRRSSQ